MRRILLFCMLVGSLLSANAQQFDSYSASARQSGGGTLFFVPHWFLSLQGGAAYDVGEAKFSQLISPALQVALGYQFNEYLGLRGSVDGLWARNRYAFPEIKYSWNFVQPAVDLQLNLSTLFAGSNPERKFQVFAFVGGGVAYTFSNKKAVDAYDEYNVGPNQYWNDADRDYYHPHIYEKLWRNNRWNPVVRGGLSCDYYVTDKVAISAEVNANMLPDHFNSKLGKNDNKDWHFNALLGVKIVLGQRYGRPDSFDDTVRNQQPPANFVDVPAEKISFNVNIYFLINQSIIRSNQINKLTRLIAYLNEHPRAFVRLSGYADKDTGTPEINMRLSVERSLVVSKYLQDAGIPEWRIRRFAKGDRVQPFDIPEDNRVCICYVYDPDNPEPRKFDY